MRADARAVRRLENEVRRARTIYDEHAGLQDRFVGAGACARAGGAARARRHGRARERQAWTCASTTKAALRRARRAHGDAPQRRRRGARRRALRRDFESLRLIRAHPGAPAPASRRARSGSPQARAVGAGWVEGWRGEVFVALERGDRAARSAAAICHDPSWQNWPVLEHAVIGNIVPDFPLINKSFNLIV